MSPKRGIKIDQIKEFAEQSAFFGLKTLATGGTEFFGTQRYSNIWGTALIRSSASGADVTLAAWPIPIPEPVSVDALRITVSTAADAGDDVRLGIYVGDGVGGVPATLLTETTDIAVDSTGTKTATFTAVLLSPGLYWFAILGVNIDGVTTPIFRGSSAEATFLPYFADADIIDGNARNQAWVSLTQGAASAMPDPYATDAVWGGASNNPGLIYIQARVA